MNQNNDNSRRKFFSDSMLLGLGVVGSAALLKACSGDENTNKSLNLSELSLPQLLEKAPDGIPLKAGLIGCGGRGSGAAIDFLEAGNGLEIVAIGDLFQDRVNECREKLKNEKNVNLPDNKVFVGFDAYKSVIDAGVDIIIMATPPHFRPLHFEAAIAAGKHVFMEKPVAVDPVGVRSVLATAQKATAMGLTVVTGTQRRHQLDYVEAFIKIKEGIIGDITGANVYWNQNMLWYRKPEKTWSEMEAHVRDWVNWNWLSGDHIVEQHIHNMDVAHWFIGKYPIKAVGMGGRMRRLTGDQFDFFSIDYVFENGIHMHSMCRQIDGCAGNVGEVITGTKGMFVSGSPNKIIDFNGKVLWEYKALDKDGKELPQTRTNGYKQEHIDLVTAIRTNKPFNEAENTAKTNLVAIMGRMSAYTGKEVSWDDVMYSDLKLGPDKYELGAVNIKPVIPIPGDGSAS